MTVGFDSLRAWGERHLGWRRQTLVVGLIVIVLFAFLIVRQYATRPSSDQDLFHVTRDAGPVVDDESLDALLGGTAALPSDAGLVSYCVNGWYWATDATVDTNVVVVSADRYYNAAAGVADGSFERDLVVAVEGDVFADGLVSPRVDDVSDDVRARYGDEKVAAYLEAIAEPASEATLRRFIVYAASESLFRQRLQFIDLAQRDRESIRRFMNEPGGRSVVRVAGDPESVDVSRDACAPLLAGPPGDPPVRSAR